MNIESQAMQNIINIVLFIMGSGITVLGWFARQIREDVKELKNDLQWLQVALPTKYVPKNEFSDGLREVKAMLDKIIDRLDNKMDK